jgi:hypothetical protein
MAFHVTGSHVLHKHSLRPDAFQRAILRVTDQACHRTFSFNVRNPQDEVVYHVDIPFNFPRTSSPFARLVRGLN